jgi:hypothetical protein
VILNKNNAEILYNALLQRYPNGMRPISDLSRNTDGVPGGKKFIECPHLAFNYDLVTNCATNNGVKEKSPDSLFLDVDRLHFIEFKEGQAKRIELRQKIHEALVTLFQFAITNNILNRDEFLALDFRYTVVRRLQKQHPMANALDISIDNFQLKNLEGFLIKATDVRWAPQKILELLSSVTNRGVRTIDYYCPQGNCSTVTI